MGGTSAAVTITGAPERLGKMLFCFEKQLTQVGIPSSVTEIGEKAFWDCDGADGHRTTVEFDDAGTERVSTIATASSRLICPPG